MQNIFLISAIVFFIVSSIDILIFLLAKPKDMIGHKLKHRAVLAEIERIKKMQKAEHE